MDITSELGKNLEDLGGYFVLKRRKIVESCKDALFDIQSAVQSKANEVDVVKAKVLELEVQLKDETERRETLLQSKNSADKKAEQSKEQVSKLYNKCVSSKAKLTYLYEKCLDFKGRVETGSIENKLLKSQVLSLIDEFNTAKTALSKSSYELDLLSEEYEIKAKKLTLAQESEEWLETIERLLSTETTLPEATQKFKQLVEKDFIISSNKVTSLAEEAETYRELQAISQELSIVSQFSGIKDKSILVIAGGFSSGKSQFLNSLSDGYSKKTSKEHAHLKVGTTATTAIPTYIAASHSVSNDCVTAYTAHGGSVQITSDQYHKLTHNYVKKVQFDIRTILPYASISYPMRIEQSEHISFVDTPGIDASDKGITGNDKEATENFVKQATALLWFVGIKSTGTISHSDLVFLREIQSQRPDLPIYLVANQCDAKGGDVIEDILDQFEDDLDDQSIEYVGVSAYSSFVGEEYTYRKTSLWEFIEGCNKKHLIQNDLKARLASVFNSYQSAFEDENDKNEKVEQHLNNLSLTILSDTGDMDLEERLRPKIEELRGLVKKNGMENLVEEFSGLHHKMLDCIHEVFNCNPPRS